MTAQAPSRDAANKAAHDRTVINGKFLKNRENGRWAKAPCGLLRGQRTRSANRAAPSWPTPRCVLCRFVSAQPRFVTPKAPKLF
jgi:hypothetical protein